MSTVYAIGSLKRNSEGKFELIDVSIYSEDPWRITMQITPDIICVQMSPPIPGETFDAAKKLAQEFVENVYRHLPKDLFEWVST